MNALSPIVAGLCLLLGACSSAKGSTYNAQRGASATAGSSGSSETGSPGGDTAGAGSNAEGGGTSAAAGSSGANGQAGSGAADSGAGATPQTDGVAGTLDYSIWVLQLPTGSGTSPTTISSRQLLAGFSNSYFYEAADGGQAFMDPATGITTSGSQHCRTEMRESNADGGQAAWAASATNSMTVAGKLLMVGGGSNGIVTVGQIFNGTDSIPLCELEYITSAGGFRLLYEEAKGGGIISDLKTPVALGTRYSFALALSNGVLTVAINGRVVHTQTPSAAALAKKFYFKFGNYDQTALPGAVSTAPYTVLETYGVNVVHE